MNPLTDWLISMTGTTLGFVLAIVIYLFAWFWVWGLWTALILSKAGFDHQPFLLLYLPLNLPILVLPIGELILNYQAFEYLLGICAISLWLGVILTAVIPWPSRQKPKPKAKKLNLNDAV